MHSLLDATPRGKLRLVSSHGTFRTQHSSQTRPRLRQQSAAPSRMPSLTTRLATDEELRRWRRFYQRRLVLVEEEVAAPRAAMTDAELGACNPHTRAALVARGADRAVPIDQMRTSARDFYRIVLNELGAEEASRQRAAQMGVPRDGDTFPPGYIAAIKRRVALDDLLIRELDARLGKPNARGVRRGWCPICQPSAQSDALAVYVADPDDQHFSCFRCGARGDCFDAIGIAYGFSFAEALRRLASLSGIALPGKGVRHA
jgi:hypothetical protein